MGKLFKSWFKKKKSQESIIHPTFEVPFQKQQLPLTNTKLYTPDEEPLTFTHGSLLDDVLNGLKDHHEYPKTNQDAPDSPLSSSVRHLDSWSKIGTVPEQQNQQKQTIGESYGNNGASAQQQNRVSQTFLCSPPSTPETPSDTFSAPPPSSTKMMAPLTSAATPSLATPSSSSTSLTPPRLIQNALHRENGLATPPSPANDQLDDSEESSSSPDTVGSNDMTPNRHHHQQQKSNMGVKQQHDTHHHRLSSIKSPSITSSHESNQDKRNNRYMQATGVSMSRMKERHRQECRRSMQSNGQQQQQQPSDSYLHPPSQSHHPSFQSTPLLNQQQQQQQKPHPKLQQNRHLIASPSMPSIYPVEPMSPPLHPLSQQHHPIPAAANSATSYSFPPPPTNTMSMARSSSLMTDIHYQQQSTPGGNIGTMAMSPLANDLMHPPPPSWRQQPLFPYQSDIILPPYSPSQLGTFQQQQQQIIQSPYRTKQALLPRSASVYGNVNQYHYKHHPPHDIHHSSGVLLRSPTMDFNGSRKLTPTSTRPYQPQLLSLSTQPPPLPLSDQSQGAKKQPEGSMETSASLPAFFLPSSSSPSKVPTPSKQQQTPLSSSASSMVSSVCTTPTNNIDQKLPAATRGGHGDEIKDAAKDVVQVVSRHASTSTSCKKGDLDENLGTPTPAAEEEEEESSPSKKKHRHRHQRRQRRRYSLPTTIPILSTSQSSSVHSTEQNGPSNNEKDLLEGKGHVISTENLGKLEIDNDQCQHQHHHHHQATGSPPSACPTTHGTGMHLCNGGVYASAPTASCCPSTPLSPSSPTCQSPHHHHHHHHPPPPSHYHPHHQHYVDHAYPCAHSAPMPPPPCCPPPPSCCSSHRSHHHRHHKSHRHRHHHHHSTASTKQQMRKSKSCMTKAAMEDDDDQDDAMTIGSTAAPPPTSKSGRQHQRRQRHHQSMPASHSMIGPIRTSDDDDDDHTVNGEDTTTTTTTITKEPDTLNMKKSPSMQKPFLRSLLPRAPRFTSLPRSVQDQQQHQQKSKLTTSKSSYSWMSSRA